QSDLPGYHDELGGLAANTFLHNDPITLRGPVGAIMRGGPLRVDRRELPVFACKQYVDVAARCCRLKQQVLATIAVEIGDDESRMGRRPIDTQPVRLPALD